MSAHRPLRARPRACRASAALGHVLGLVALLTQICLPWLQGWHAADEANVRVFARSTAAHRHVPSIASGSDVAASHAQHDDDACSVCRLIGQSRAGMLLRTGRVADVHLVQRLVPAAPSVWLSRLSCNAAAPRAPPVFLA